MIAGAVQSADLSSLTLDAAIQLDRIQKHKSADRSIIKSFARRLASPAGASGSADLFCLHENPVSVDIMSSAIRDLDGAKLVNMGELEAVVKDLVARVNDVASGKELDDREVANLKQFCLSLHRILLEELSPKSDNDEWMPALHASFA
jgi:hypothetical protein